MCGSFPSRINLRLGHWKLSIKVEYVFEVVNSAWASATTTGWDPSGIFLTFLATVLLLLLPLQLYDRSSERAEADTFSLRAQHCKTPVSVDRSLFSLVSVPLASIPPFAVRCLSPASLSIILGTPIERLVIAGVVKICSSPWQTPDGSV